MLETYTGMDVVALVSAGYDFSAFYPNREGWNGGTRNVTCYVIRADGSKMTGSVHVGAATPAP